MVVYWLAAQFSFSQITLFLFSISLRNETNQEMLSNWYSFMEKEIMKSSEYHNQAMKNLVNGQLLER